MDALVIRSSRRRPSRTRRLMQVVETAARDRGLDPTVLDLGETDQALFDGRPFGDYDAPTRRAVRALMDADVWFLGSPVYFSGYPGALKNLFDLLPYEEFAGTRRAAGLFVCGRDRRHMFAVETQFRPLLRYLGVDVARDDLFATEADFDGFDLESPAIEDRIDTVVDATVTRWEEFLAV